MKKPVNLLPAFFLLTSVIPFSLTFAFVFEDVAFNKISQNKRNLFDITSFSKSSPGIKLYSFGQEKINKLESPKSCNVMVSGLPENQGLNELIASLPSPCTIYIMPGVYSLRTPLKVKTHQKVISRLNHEVQPVPGNPVLSSSFSSEPYPGIEKSSSQSSSYSLLIMDGQRSHSTLPDRAVITAAPELSGNHLLELDDEAEVMHLAIDLTSLSVPPGESCHHSILTYTQKLKAENLLFMNGAPCSVPVPGFTDEGTEPRTAMMRREGTKGEGRQNNQSNEPGIPTLPLLNNQVFPTKNNDGGGDDRKPENNLPDDNVDMVLDADEIDFIESVIQFLLTTLDIRLALRYLAQWFQQHHPLMLEIFTNSINSAFGTHFDTEPDNTDAVIGVLTDEMLSEFQNQHSITLFATNVFVGTDEEIMIASLTAFLDSFAIPIHWISIGQGRKARTTFPLYHSRPRMQSLPDVTQAKGVRSGYSSSQYHSRQRRNLLRSESRLLLGSTAPLIRRRYRESRIFELASRVTESEDPTGSLSAVIKQTNPNTPLPTESVINNPKNLVKFLTNQLSTTEDDDIDKLPGDRYGDAAADSEAAFPICIPPSLYEPQIVSSMPPQLQPPQPEIPLPQSAGASPSKTGKLLKAKIPKSKYSYSSKWHWGIIELYTEKYKRKKIAENIRPELKEIRDSKFMSSLSPYFENLDKYSELARHLSTFITDYRAVRWLIFALQVISTESNPDDLNNTTLLTQVHEQASVQTLLDHVLSMARQIMTAGQITQAVMFVLGPDDVRTLLSQLPADLKRHK